MGEKVLVIEDDVEINELLGEYLGLEGLQYIAAVDGDSGLKKAQADLPDAIILDVMLPDIDGYEIARQLSARRSTATIPIIMLTCMNQDCDSQKGLAAGAFQYMGKPFLPDDLLHRLKDAFTWKHHLATRPPAGQVEISPENPQQTLHGINEMIVDIYARTALPDTSINPIRDAFHLLRDWALNWGKQRDQNPHLLVHYRLLKDNQLAAGTEADQIEWTLSELEAGLLADTLFAPPPLPPDPKTPTVTDDQNKPSPLAPWYQFLAKCGISRLEKDSKIGQVRLYRNLNADAAVPVVTIDGCRTPTRIRDEAIAARCRKN